MLKNIQRISIIIVIILLINSICFATNSGITLPTIEIGVNNEATPQETAATLKIIILLTVLALAPSILIMMTSFTRIIIILSFLRNALGTQQMPPNQILTGLALFLTLFIMTPTFTEINQNAFTPYMAGEVTQSEALERAKTPIKNFMLSQMRGEEELSLFMNLSNVEAKAATELPLTIIIPAFVLNELKIAFQMGFILYIPFLVIDMIVASTLMSMGMMMLPPVTISLPFKILLFVLVDGWNLVITSMITGFRLG